MAEQAKITIHPSYELGEISPRLFSTFLEPIGTMVNGTMYNPKHPTADGQGFRQDFIKALRATDMPAVRLPGGNFVSAWNWKDSIGPRDQRKVRLDPAWHQYITNEVGHDEYLQWAEKVETEPLYTINLGTGDMRDAMDLVEYTNHEGGTWWSDLRRKNGHEKPYDVKTWYLGNEMDGPWQIGSWDKDPRGYGVRANEVSKAIKWIDGRIETAVCASSAPFMDHYPQWEETVLQECFDSVDYLSMHHYHSAPPGDIKALLGGAAYYEDFINTEVALCDLVAAKCRSPKKLMLSIDEYGAMIRPNSPLHPGYGYHNMIEAHYRFDPDKKYVLHDPDNMTERFRQGGDMLQMLSMASIQLAFLRHADRVKIGCMTGGLRALCCADREHVWKSASHYVFIQMMEYARGISMRTAVACETFDLPGYAIDDTSQYTGKEGLNYIDAASAWDREKERLTVFVINRSQEKEYPLTLDVSGFEGYTFQEHLEIYCDDLECGNSYEEPDRIRPEVHQGGIFEKGLLKTHVKPLSWNVIIMKKQPAGNE
ncbi:MAG: alpha-L-arabinofuranosidase [Lachnospiraceae bacterium]|nr:alpha-L-arabinofuranosidase [Lachnospiraceae bacterium]